MRTIIALFAACIFTLTACDKINELLTFEIKDDFTFTIPSTVGLNVPTNIPTPSIPTSIEEGVIGNNTSADLIKDITLKQMSFQITNPASANFNFLESVHLYISADGLEEKLVAYMDNVPDGLTTLELITITDPLDAYIKQSTYDIRADIVTDELILQDTDIKGNFTFDVTADPL